jgi:hypothetical protein
MPHLISLTVVAAFAKEKVLLFPMLGKLIAAPLPIMGKLIAAPLLMMGR